MFQFIPMFEIVTGIATKLTVALRNEVINCKNMRKLMVERICKSESRGNKIIQVNSIASQNLK